MHLISLSESPAGPTCPAGPTGQGSPTFGGSQSCEEWGMAGYLMCYSQKKQMASKRVRQSPTSSQINTNLNEIAFHAYHIVQNNQD